MSLLRQRATDVSVESTFKAGRPALARLRFVSVMRVDSDEELNEPASQPNARDGAAYAQPEVTANSKATERPSRRDDAVLRTTSEGVRDETMGPASWDMGSGRSGLDLGWWPVLRSR